MARTRAGRLYDDHLGRNWRATKNAKHRRRTKWARETFGSDQRIKKNRKRQERRR